RKIRIPIEEFLHPPRFARSDNHYQKSVLDGLGRLAEFTRQLASVIFDAVPVGTSPTMFGPCPHPGRALSHSFPRQSRINKKLAVQAGHRPDNNAYWTSDISDR